MRFIRPPFEQKCTEKYSKLIDLLAFLLELKPHIIKGYKLKYDFFLFNYEINKKTGTDHVRNYRQW